MSTYDDDAEIIAAARAGFLDEAADMLAQFEQALLVTLDHVVVDLMAELDLSEEDLARIHTGFE